MEADRMLDATRQLIDTVGFGAGGANNPAAMSPRRRSATAAALRRHGSHEDAEALLPLFLAAPQTHADLLPIFAEHGDGTLAERLLTATVTDDGVLRDGVPSGVLRVLGYLGHEPAEQLLWHHVVRDEGDHSEAMDAALGLLHLPCEGLRDQIDAALDLYYGDNLFPEFLPALALKTGSAAWLSRLVEWGERGASTDCNGGLILGIALHGEPGRAEFTRLLWDPHWEADSGATGSSRWAYAGARVLGFDMAELYRDLTRRLTSPLDSEDADAATKAHCLATFTALLTDWIRQPWLGLRMAPDPEESADELATLLFEWSTPHRNDSLTGLAYRTLGSDHRITHAIHELERRLDVRLQHEAELQVLG